MIDLHTHTIYSDGEYTPLQILNMCKQKGITTVAITDHNTLEGSKRAILGNPYKDITVISGVEFGALYPLKGADLHILGLNIDLQNKDLNDISKAIMEDNVERIKNIIFLLKKHYGFSFKNEDVEDIFKSVGNIGRPDVAKLCMKYGFAKNVEYAFSHFLNPIDYLVPKRKHELTDKSCIEYIKNAGGTACLAHPFTLKKDFYQLAEYIQKLMEFGLEAIEVFHSEQGDEYSKRLMQISNELGLLYSVGSDFHGPIVSPNIQLGYGRNNNLCKNTATILSKFNLR